MALVCALLWAWDAVPVSVPAAFPRAAALPAEPSTPGATPTGARRHTPVLAPILPSARRQAVRAAPTGGRHQIPVLAPVWAVLPAPGSISARLQLRGRGRFCRSGRCRCGDISAAHGLFQLIHTCAQRRHIVAQLRPTEPDQTELRRDARVGLRRHGGERVLNALQVCQQLRRCEGAGERL